MLMFGVIMSGDTGEQVCVLQNASSARRKREVQFFFMMKRCSPVRADVRNFAFQGGPWVKRAHRGAVPCQVSRGSRRSNGELS